MDALEDLDAGVTTYSGMFNAFHDIIHPRKAAKEFRVEVQSPITKQFGLTHALKFVTLTKNPMAAMFGGSAAPKEPADGVRTYHLGAYFVQRDSPKAPPKTVVHAAFGVSAADSLASVQQQLSRNLTARGAVWARPDGSIWHTAAAWYKGVDFTVAAHTANASLLHLSYLQRLATSEPLRNVQLGGELMYDHSLVGSLLQRPDLSDRLTPMGWSLGASVGFAESYTALGAVWKPNRAPLEGFVGLQREVTPYSTLVAKYELKPFVGASTTSVGYKVRFPRSRSVVQCAVDSNQVVKGSFERRLLSNAKLRVNALINKTPKVVPGQPPSPGEGSHVGITLTIGNMPKEPLWLSPALLRAHTVLHRALNNTDIARTSGKKQPPRMI